MSTVVDTPLGPKNMDFIVRCLESHDVLVSALRTALNTLETLSSYPAISDDFWNEGGDGYEAYRTLNDALRAVREDV